MFGMNNMELWKLHTLEDYLFFLSLVAVFILIGYFFMKKISSGRNDAAAIKRVSKKLKSPKGKVYNNITLELEGQRMQFDHLLIDAAGLVVFKSVGFGLKIYGSADEETWKVIDNQDNASRIANPVRELEAKAEPLRRYLTKGGLYHVVITPLVIFADPFDTPELYLGRDSGCIIYKDLKDWVSSRTLRAANRSEKIKLEDAVRLIEKAIVPEAPEK